MPISRLLTAAGPFFFGDYFGAKNSLAYLASRFSKPCSKPRMRASQEIFSSFCRARRRKPKHSSSAGYQAIRLPTMIAMSRRNIRDQRSEVRGQRSDFVGQAFLAAEHT